jgi:hypothetical protein
MIQFSPDFIGSSRLFSPHQEKRKSAILRQLSTGHNNETFRDYPYLLVLHSVLQPQPVATLKTPSTFHLQAFQDLLHPQFPGSCSSPH